MVSSGEEGTAEGETTPFTNVMMKIKTTASIKVKTVCIIGGISCVTQIITIVALKTRIVIIITREDEGKRCGLKFLNILSNTFSARDIRRRRARNLSLN